MKLAKAAVPSIALVLWGGASVFAAEVPSPYVQIGAGANFLEGINVTNSVGTVTTRSSLNFNVGPVVTGSVGYAFGNGVRGELEFGYRESGAKNVTLPSGATVGGSFNFKAQATAYTWMANAIYDFSLPGSLARWSPHVGGGIGAVNIQTNRSPSDTVFGGQAIAGVEYVYSPTLRFGLDYRFIGTPSVHLSFTQDAISAGRTVSTNYYDHSILATVRWKFGLPGL